jgi:hypothetical protein
MFADSRAREHEPPPTVLDAPPSTTRRASGNAWTAANGETLSIFPLTVIVQKIAAEAAETLGTNPDSYGRDLPGRDAAWSAIKL